MKKIFSKKNFRDLFSFHWLRNKIFFQENIQIPLNFLIKILILGAIIIIVLSLFFFFQIYVPLKPFSHETIIFVAEKGWGDEEIAHYLKKSGIIRSSYFFRFYTLISLKHLLLKAGKYRLSPNMSIYQIVNKMVKGEVIKENIIILEGWTAKEIGDYLEKKQICKKEEFNFLITQDYSQKFSFLNDKPKDLNLEGYLFPDTYEISEKENCENIILKFLYNFDKKLSQDLRTEISRQGKTIFEIITMASMIEKEIKISEEKKIVSGILWKRLTNQMPLQVDATVNYITGKNDPAVLVKDTQIDSPYNTYKYKGLPKGPISNPGLDSILAAIYPIETDYWYYLSTNGRTVFSKNFKDHILAKEKYLKKK